MWSRPQREVFQQCTFSMDLLTQQMIGLWRTLRTPQLTCWLRLDSMSGLATTEETNTQDVKQMITLILTITLRSSLTLVSKSLASMMFQP